MPRQTRRLQTGSGIESRTLASLEYGWKEGRDPLTNRDVLVIDEAGMVGSRQLDRVLKHADQAGAKVVLLGDDKQLSAIEAGAGFRAITERTGATEITEIRRQRDSWAREASAEFARGDVRTALDAYHERGNVRMVESRDDAKAAVAADYLADRQRGGSAIVLAHSNNDVAGLNQAIRSARAEAGELGPSAEIETSRGKRDFAQGDRLLFLKNDRHLDVKNGTLGTVQKAEDGRLSVRLDNGREVGFSAKDYEHIDHGYAVTVHKSQGVTVDRSYVLATPGMDRSLAYVGMTRHRDSATLYAGADDFTERQSGRLVEHGAAPYEHDPQNGQSYFARLETNTGKQHTLWGVDLERAIADRGAKIGDRISFEHVGSETVHLPDGEAVERNSWCVRDGSELVYEKLARQLSRARPKESTLDFAERHGVEVDEGIWTVSKLDPAKAKALAESLAQRPAAAAQGAASKEAGKTSFERLDGAEKVATAASARQEPPAPVKSRTQEIMQARQQAAFAKLKERAAPGAGESSKPDPDERRRQAAKIVTEAAQRSAEKAGKPIGEQA
ncbi:AAA family ATPase [Xanthomonas fragariae]|uniref:AAA family ATPase n=1 Tax=Xanthomonas fragariae TaxID=48664 RepID=UPI002D790D5F|nr:AAA family ATPase [Xanthomonas fragariae]